MTKYNIVFTPTFKKDYKLAQKRGYDLKLLQDVVILLSEGKPLSKKKTIH